MIKCSECGARYNDDRSYCPECGNPTVSKFVNQTGLSNCPNCGAPVTNNLACEYCETAFPSTVKAPEKVIINNNTTVKNEDSGGGFAVAGAAFLGGLLGGLLDD
jgi:predicted amidophosphoribosyltransferase